MIIRDTNYAYIPSLGDVYRNMLSIAKTQDEIDSILYSAMNDNALLPHELTQVFQMAC